MRNITTIKLKKRTVGTLKKLKIVKGETYDELINRLILKPMGVGDVKKGKD
ncbi:MAG: hypothetical protein AABY22_35815 [Nanoarchaeota archaeon]